MAWTIEQIERTFLGYMERNGHVVIEGHSVRSPTDDVLFTTAGMHPLTPYLKGEPHPAGKRLADVQRCVRTTDVDEVGDNTHLTVFEMLGNWSLGDYFKETSIPQSFGLLTERVRHRPAQHLRHRLRRRRGAAVRRRGAGDLGADVRRRRRRPEGPHQPARRQLVVERPGRAVRTGHRDLRVRRRARCRRRAGAGVRRHPAVRRDLEQRVHDVRPQRVGRAEPAAAAQRRHRHGPRAAGPVHQRPRHGVEDRRAARADRRGRRHARRRPRPAERRCRSTRCASSPITSGPAWRSPPPASPRRPRARATCCAS